MHGSGRSQGWLVHLLAGAALGAVVVLLVWIFTGGRPFGEVVGATDVSEPTTPAVVKSVPATADAPTLLSTPPALKGTRGSATLRFRKPEAKRPAKKAQRTAKPAKPRRSTKRKAVVRVVAPAAEQPSGETPVAVVPSPAPTAAPPAPAAPPTGGGGGAPAKPKSPGPTLWAGEG